MPTIRELNGRNRVRRCDRAACHALSTLRPCLPCRWRKRSRMVRVLRRLRSACEGFSQVYSIKKPVGNGSIAYFAASMRCPRSSTDENTCFLSPDSRGKRATLHTFAPRENPLRSTPTLRSKRFRQPKKCSDLSGDSHVRFLKALTRAVLGQHQPKMAKTDS